MGSHSDSELLLSLSGLRVSAYIYSIEFLHGHQQHELHSWPSQVHVPTVSHNYAMSLSLYAHAQDQSYQISVPSPQNQCWSAVSSLSYSMDAYNIESCDRRPFSLFREKRKHHRVTVTLGLKPCVTRPYRVSWEVCNKAVSLARSVYLRMRREYGDLWPRVFEAALGRHEWWCVRRR